jgi:hypothetical protein
MRAPASLFYSGSHQATHGTFFLIPTRLPWRNTVLFATPGLAFRGKAFAGKKTG